MTRAERVMYLGGLWLGAIGMDENNNPSMTYTALAVLTAIYVVFWLAGRVADWMGY